MSHSLEHSCIHALGRAGLCALTLAAGAAGAADLVIYEDALAGGWQNWSWNATLGTDSSQKASGASSLTVAYSAPWAGLSYRADAPIDTAAYASLRFSVYGQAGAGRLSLYTQATDEGPGGTAYEFTPAANTWTRIDVPLSALGSPAKIARVNLMDGIGAAQPAFKLDNLRLVAKTGGTGSCGGKIAVAVGAADLMIYQDALSSGWQDWSWDASNTADATCATSGAGSLKVAFGKGWAGYSARAAAPLDTAGYSAIRFAVHGRAGAGKLALNIQPTDEGAGSKAFEFTPTPNAWTNIEVPLSALGSPARIARLNIMDSTGAAQPAFNIDALRLAGKALPAVSLAVDATALRKPISPLIYGINGQTATAEDAALLKSLGVSVRRWGGNNTTRYNWKIDAWNLALDWYFENYKTSDATNLPTDSAANRLIIQNRQAKVESLITVPMIGYVAKDSSSCGFSVAKYGAQVPFENLTRGSDEWRPDCGTGVKAVNGGKPAFVTGNKPAETSLSAPPSFTRGWVAYLAGRFGKAGAGGVRYYNLDNEPDIWFSTHRDVAPVGMKYDQFRDRTYQYAAAVKAADPAAQTLGPALMGWTYYWHSPYDGQREDWNTPDDRNAHGGLPFVPWYLQQMKAYETKNHQRILDFLDLHYYPAANGVSLAAAGDAATQQRRLNSTRSLWDPSYVDESWIARAGPDGGIVKLIPRMRDWVKTYYPGTKLAITEYNWGAPEHINGALAQADVLGIFGREGLDLATLWSAPKSAQPMAFAFRMYRNYNGAGAKFGETSVKAASSDQNRLSVYAAEETAGGALTLMVINKTAGALTSTLALSHYTPAGTLQGWRYSGAKLGSIVRLADKSFSGLKFSDSYPANSITLYRVAGHR